MSNDFLPFAVGSSANVLSQSDYAALTSILQNGFQSGIAQSVQLNKVWRQSSIMAAVLAQFIADRTGASATDDGTTATLLANLKLAAAAVNGDSTKTFSVAPATASQHAPQMAQVAGVAAPTNLIATATAGATTITITADEVPVAAALGGVRGCIANFSATLNLANSGVINGMLSGTATASGLLSVYAAMNPLTGAYGAFGVMESGAANPVIAATTISGYTLTRLLMVIPISSTAGQFAASTTVNGRTTVAASSFLAGTTASTSGSPAAISVSAMPYAAKKMGYNYSVTIPAAASGFVYVGPSSAAALARAHNLNVTVSTGGGITGAADVSITTPKTVYAYWVSSSSSVTITYSTSISWYEIF